ncbi:PTR2-domain-containing protein [Aaosphaeria arxii CBS 175.79]|uniref:PTR2-domain-containing protein n=1 Tax=Aaosphaeria arxii CBS 175.79 TaxID=1450172 RepID=A0A6A5XA49_9PLEO|nr:PTR2-domain-containing protein [Aaosphaeria arxii CBS 175.79]KAF2009736.1 PTR2-domain-containing protein [Aaosphaeria arxii CBS 175.79]
MAEKPVNATPQHGSDAFSSETVSHQYRPQSPSQSTSAPASSPSISTSDLIALRRTRDSIPWTVWAAAFMGMFERFAFYGASAPFQNYMQNSIDDPFRPGALGMGQAKATIVNYAFITFGFITPVPMAVVADKWTGRYRAILGSFALELLGLLVLFLTALPPALKASAGGGGLAVAMVLIGIGAGGVKTTVSPFVADQYTETELRVETLKSGERVIVDRTLTVQYIYNMWYWMINIGSLGGLATTLLEQYVGFWAAYLLSFISLWISVLILVIWRTKFVHEPARGNIMPQAFKACIYACRSGFNMDNTKPGPQLENYGRTVTWDDKFIDDIKRALLACRVSLGLPIFWLCWGQAFNNLISQAAAMQTYGIPNDLFKTLNPVACIIFGPIFQNWLYPFLQRHRIPFRPISRLTVGFLFMALSLALATGIQQLVYDTPPCHTSPLNCPASNGGTIPNHVNVFLQTPIYVAMAFSELLALTTSYEYAYSKAPARMKSCVQAISVFMAGVGSALGMAISPVAEDPNMVVVYGSLTGVMALNAGVFWGAFRKLDAIDEDLNDAVLEGDKSALQDDREDEKTRA